MPAKKQMKKSWEWILHTQITPRSELKNWPLMSNKFQVKIKTTLELSLRYNRKTFNAGSCFSSTNSRRCTSICFHACIVPHDYDRAHVIKRFFTKWDYFVALMSPHQKSAAFSQLVYFSVWPGLSKFWNRALVRTPENVTCICVDKNHKQSESSTLRNVSPEDTHTAEIYYTSEQGKVFVLKTYIERK